MGKGSNLLIALFAGAAAGVALGMWLKSDEGSEMKEKLSGTARKFADDFLIKAEEVIDQMTKEKTKS
jgi:hypothetical protein